MIKSIFNKIKSIFTNDNDKEVVTYNLEKEDKVLDKKIETKEDKKRKELQIICKRTKKFRIRKKLIRRIVDSFEKEELINE